MFSQVHWHEGLFLQPHHLQRMQKSGGDMVGFERRLAWPYPYGVVEARLSRDELENSRIRFDRLRVVMPSGLQVLFPENAELPSLDIKQAFAKASGPLNIYLGVPLWQEARANAFSHGQSTDTGAKLMYRIKEVECKDENTGENPRPIHMRLINARLLLEHDDQSDMEVLPLIRIVRATGEEVGLPREDPEYVPPCFVMSGSTSLRELVRDLVAQVEASRRELVVQITRGGFSIDAIRGAQIEQLMRLQTLNRFSASLPSLVQVGNSISPFVMYQQLRELLGELAALHPDRDGFDCSPYDHENSYFCFRELSSKVRSFLKGAVGPSYLSVTFKEEGELLTATFEDRHFTEPNAFLLGIKSNLDPTALARFVVNGDKFKLMPNSMAMSRVFGIALEEERHAPLALPAQSDLYYFRLATMESVRKWDQLKEEKQAVLRWDKTEIDLSDTTFTYLYDSTKCTCSVMTLLDLCEPLFQYVCKLSRMAKAALGSDYAVVRSDIKTIINQMHERALSDPKLSAQVKKIELPLIFFVDSMIFRK